MWEQKPEQLFRDTAKQVRQITLPKISELLTKDFGSGTEDFKTYILAVRLPQNLILEKCLFDGLFKIARGVQMVLRRHTTGHFPSRNKRGSRCPGRTNEQLWQLQPIKSNNQSILLARHG